MSDALHFAPLEESHLPLLPRWLNEDPVLRWYARKPLTLAEVEAEYRPLIEGRDPTCGFVLQIDGEPAGYWQTYRIADHPEYARQIDAEPEWSGMDFFIGEARFRGRGLAARAHVVFCREHTPTPVVVAGPDPENRASIRSLESAGFVVLRTVEVEPGVREMLLARSDCGTCQSTRPTLSQ